MDSLFDNMQREAQAQNMPLAVSMRPRSLDELFGQDEAVGKGSWLRHAIETDSLSSVVFFGPAGTGKTSLARVIAQETKAAFCEVSAVSGGVADLRREIDAAKNRLMLNSQRTILFVDEIHRFSRSQQDALLHAVEDRTVILVGATTENPFFEVNSALLSRSRVIELKALPDTSIAQIVDYALVDKRGLDNKFTLSRSALEAIILTAAGDARMALTTLELAAPFATEPAMIPEEEQDAFDKDNPRPAILLDAVKETSLRRTLPYDKTGDMHYDIISAFIKSMRGSDPDAAVYWLARMIEGGEDPRFIARRIFILASEDIGNADPNAILVAHAAFKAAESIGYPECRINLAQAAIYMALAPKSNAAVMAIDLALKEVRNGPARAVPAHLRDRHRPGSEEYGPYLYPHSYPSGWVEQQYLPDGLSRGDFFTPSERGWEYYRTQYTSADKAQTSRDKKAPLSSKANEWDFLEGTGQAH